MANLTTVLAGLVFVVSQGAVERSKLSKLVTLELVLVLERRVSRLNDIVNQLLGFVDFVLVVGHNQAVEVLFLIARVSRVRSTLAFLDGSFAANGNLGAGLRLHLLQSVATRANK